MLDTMKKKKGLFPKALLWTLLTLGTVGLTFFGIVNTSFFGTGGAAADVNRDRISLVEVSRAVERRRQPGQTGAAQEEALREQVLESLIQRKLIVQAAEKIPLIISPEEVLEEITKYEPFKEDGRFSPTKYREILRANQINARTFENSLRENSVIQKVNLAFQAALQPLSLQKEKVDELRNSRVNVEFLEISPLTVASRDFRKDEVEQFLADPTRGAQVKDLYDRRKADRYTVQEQVRARQVFIPKDDKDAKKLADEVYQAASSRPFEELVKEFSKDEFSKSRGGDLGFFNRGAHEPVFDDVVFRAEAGQVTPPILTSQGYHVVKIEEKTPAVIRSLEEVQDEIAKELLREEYAKRLVNLIKDSIRANDIDALGTLVRDHNLNWKETGFFDLSQPVVPQIGTSETFIRESFKLQQKGEYSPADIHVGEKTYFVRLKERGGKVQEADEMEGFAKQLERFLIQQQAQAAFGGWIQSLRESGKVRKYNNQF